MFKDSDYEEIRALLHRACDHCLLTRKHCESCNVDRLHGIVEVLENESLKPSYLVPMEEMNILTNPASPEYIAISKKWKEIIAKEEITTL